MATFMRSTLNACVTNSLGTRGPTVGLPTVTHQPAHPMPLQRLLSPCHGEKKRTQKSLHHQTSVGGCQPNSKLACCDALAWKVSSHLATLTHKLFLSFSSHTSQSFCHSHLFRSYPHLTASLATGTLANQGSKVTSPALDGKRNKS